MDRKAFQAWLSGADALTEAQKAAAGEILAGRPVGAASLAAIELGIGEDRCCPRCGATGAVANGKARGLQRYLCKACGRTFGALTGTRLSGLHRKEEWLTFGACLAEGDSIKASAERCGVAVSTAFRWRHRFLEAVETGAGKLRGIVEADETFVLGSRKGDRAWKRRRFAQPLSLRPSSRSSAPMLCWSPMAAPAIPPAPPPWASATRSSTRPPASGCGANCTSKPSTIAIRG